MYQQVRALITPILSCFLVWLVFAIIGVELFGGRFAYCERRLWDDEAGEEAVGGLRAGGERVISLSLDILYGVNKTGCLNLGHVFYWSKPRVSFNSVGSSFIALFHIVRIAERIK